MKPQIGTIYETITSESDFPVGTRVEFIGGEDDDVYCDGILTDWLGNSDVHRSSDQSPLGYTKEMQLTRGRCMSGSDPL